MGLLDDKDEFRWSDAAAGFSRTVGIDPLGAPVDLINSGLNALGVYKALGLQVPTKPFGGSQSISDFYKYLGYQDNPGSVGDTVGEVAGSLIPLVASGGALAGTKVGRTNVAEVFDKAKGYITGNRSNLSEDQLMTIREHLIRLEKGYPAKNLKIKNLMTPEQFADYQRKRLEVGLKPPIRNEFAFNPYHIKEERMFQDGYSAEDVYKQIKSATSLKSKIITDSEGRPNLHNLIPRNDDYANLVNDVMGFERKDKPSVRTVYPKGDGKKDLPRKKKKGLLD